jgi:hypothetical protein
LYEFIGGGKEGGDRERRIAIKSRARTIEK